MQQGRLQGSGAHNLLLFEQAVSATTTNESKSDLGFSACERVIYTVQKRKPDMERHLPTKLGACLTASNKLTMRKHSVGEIDTDPVHRQPLAAIECSRIRGSKWELAADNGVTTGQDMHESDARSIRSPGAGSSVRVSGCTVISRSPR